MGPAKQLEGMADVMHVIHARNVNDAYVQGRTHLQEHGVVVSRRLGTTPVLCKEVSYPVTTCYEQPTERVLYCPSRDANPFFHLMEAIWMFAGRSDVRWLTEYNKRMTEYSDDGYSFYGAYGNRWRNSGYGDQILTVIKKLKDDPTTRQATIMIGHPRDTFAQTVDMPCNLVCAFNKVSTGKLNMTVFARSNDAIWGAYGANAVHFSMLHELVCIGADLPQGSMIQISNNFHEYVTVADKHLIVENSDYYERKKIKTHKLSVISVEQFLQDCEFFCIEVPSMIKEPFLNHIAMPMKTAWRLRAHNKTTAIDHLDSMPSGNDWQFAAQAWLRRRLKGWT